MSDTHDHDKTTFVRAPGMAPAAEDAPAAPLEAHDQTFMMKPSARAREAAAALSAEREAKRAQTLPPLAPERGPSLDSVDFDVTAGFGDEVPAGADEFFDITQAAGDGSAAGDMPASAPVAPAASVAAPPPPPPAPTSSPAPAPAEAPAAGGAGKLALIAVVVVAVLAAALWFAMR